MLQEGVSGWFGWVAGMLPVLDLRESVVVV
ncbi:hypothetical protein FB468_2122 [Leucobacter komagatae]|uniref:Uncharacterized protein n=1 Tax=Leucobacter komagatae TaxID=55969 RepID=A0A542Y7L4_9MICO|nr:hypothetical protein FB468_2122 [Leucobacter komagatae]